MRFGLLVSFLYGFVVYFHDVCVAGTVTFGTGANEFQMEFATIGSPGNAPDTTGAPNPAGAIDYSYGIGKFEVSREMITKFNASQSLQISLADLSPYGGNGASRPATGISWNEAARFVNWLNTSTAGFAAYKFSNGGVNDDIELWTAADTEDFDASNPYRSKRATYVLPSSHEWYKAAFFDPSNSTYYTFATGSNTVPTATASGTAANTAVYVGKDSSNDDLWPLGPSDVNQAGGLSPFGVMGLGGNVFEWTESAFGLNNSSPTFLREIRGGVWNGGSSFLTSSFRGMYSPQDEYTTQGFRVAINGGNGGGGGGGAIPEPSTLAIFGLSALGMAYRARRK
jgi:sulfatase modifying factor 1